MTRIFAVVTATMAVVTTPLAAQSYRTVVETRRVDGNRPLTVDASFAAGDLIIHGADASRTYRVALTYDEEAFQPTIRYDDAARRLSVDLGDKSRVNVKDREKLDQQLDLGLPRDVPLDLALTFGALHATMDLGDMTLRSAIIKTGASETTVAFARPTRGSCEQLEFNVGAAQFEAMQLGNSGCRTVTLQGAVGEMTLDFSGDHRAPETRLFVKVGLGEVRIRVPQSMGIRMNTDRFLATVDRAGLVKQGSVYVTPGYDAAGTKLLIDIDAALGSVSLERIP